MQNKLALGKTWTIFHCHSLVIIRPPTAISIIQHTLPYPFSNLQVINTGHSPAINGRSWRRKKGYQPLYSWEINSLGTQSMVSQLFPTGHCTRRMSRKVGYSRIRPSSTPSCHSHPAQALWFDSLLDTSPGQDRKSNKGAIKGRKNTKRHSIRSLKREIGRHFKRAKSWECLRQQNIP